MKEKQSYSIRKIKGEEQLPFELLLLADETIAAINKYVYESNVYLLESEAGLVGVYVLKTIDQHIAEIKNIAVHPSYQGKGLGTMLLDHAAQSAKSNGFTCLLIGTGDASLKQLKLYRREGFVSFRIIQDFFINNYPMPIYENGIQLKDMILLKKALG